MPANKRIWVYCKICEKQIQFVFDEDFQEKFHKKATYFPYPIIYPHENHYAILYLDKDLDDRGIVVSNITYKNQE